METFFGEQVDVMAGKMPPKVGEATDGRHEKGTAGIHMSSVPASFDNIIVFAGGLAVDAQDKLAAAWGALKSTY
jgi:hypothetical protein